MKKNYSDPNKNWFSTIKLPSFNCNSKTVALFLIAFFHLGILSEVKAQSGIYESYAILNSNGGGNIYYDLQATSGNPDFQGENLGTYHSGNTLILNGAQNKVYKCNTDDILSPNHLYYRIYKTTDSPPVFSTSDIFFGSNDSGGGPGCQNQTWESYAANINVLNGLSSGNYYLEIYTTADFTYTASGGGSGTHLADNGGNYYKATFTFSPVVVELTSQTNLACNGTFTGAIDITASGKAPFTYDWADITGTSDTEDRANLAAGAYSVVVTDATGFSTAPLFVTITQPAALSFANATVTSPILCNGGTGIVTIAAAGGSAPISYTFNSQTNTTGIFTGVLAGINLSYSITDGNSCGPLTGTINVSEPTALSLTSTAVTSPILCNGGTGTVTIAAAGGSAPISYTFNSQTNTTGIFRGVLAGINLAYSITDGNSCGPITGTINVSQPTALTITTISSNTPICFGATLNLSSSASGGTGVITYSWTGPNSFISNIQNPSISGATIAASGTYNLTVTDTNGCSTNSTTNVIVNPLPTAIAGGNRTIYRGDATILGAASIAGHTYNWVSNPIGFTSSTANPTVSPLVTTTYTLTETSAQGCIKSNSVTVTVSDHLVVSKSLISVAPTKPGDNITYQISYSNLNNNGIAAQNVTITDFLPPTTLFTYTSSNPAGTYNSIPNTLSWNFASLAAGSGTITISGKVGALGAYGYDVASYYVSNSSSTQTINNSASIVNAVTTAVVSNVVSNSLSQFCGINMPITLNGQIHTSTGSNVFYFIEVENTGNITDRFTLTNNNPIQTGVPLTSVITNMAGDPITQTPWLAPGSKYGFLVQFTTPGGTPPDYTNHTFIKATSAVCNTTAITDISTYVYNGAQLNGCDLLLSKTASAGSVVAGANIIYTIIVRNLNGKDAKDIVIDDYLPASLTHISSLQTGASAITWNGTSRLLRVTKTGKYSNTDPDIVITLVAQTQCSTVPSVTNNATVDNSNADNNVLNNDGNVTVTVVPNVSDPLPTSSVVCSGNSATIAMPSPGANRDYKWYSAATGGTLLQTNGNTYTTGVLSSSTAYYVSQYNTLSTTCESNRTAIPVTVVSAPVVVAQPVDHNNCSSPASFTYNVTGTFLSQQWQVSTNGGVSWSNLANTGVYSGVTTQTLYISNVTGLNSYKYKCILNSFSCYTLTSNVVTIIALPTLPLVGTITQPTCDITTGSVVLSGLPSGNWTINPGGIVGTGANITISGLAIGTYNFSVTNNAGCTSPASADVTISSLVTNTWNGTWSAGSPTIDHNIVFSAGFSSTSDVVGCSCTVTNGAVVFKPNHTLKITNWVHVNGGSLTFEDTSSLVQINNVSNTNLGNILYQRETTRITKMDYTYWAAPVSPFTLGGVSPNTSGDKMYSYDSSVAPDGVWAQESPVTAMLPGVGYIIRGPQNFVPPMPPSTYKAPFVGVPNNGHYEITGIFADRSYLLGNPYPSALDADTFLDANQNVLDGTLYFWTHNTPIAIGTPDPGSGLYAYSGNDYASYNRTGGVSTAEQAPSSIPPFTGLNENIPSGKIASGQGFFGGSKVSLPSNPKIVYDNAMRVGVGTITGNNSQFFKTKDSKTKTINTIEKHRIWLDLINTQGAFKQTLVGYVTDATNDYEGRFDGESYDGNDFLDFYSILQDKNLTIQGRALPFDENDEIPLGYRVAEEGTFSVLIDQTDGLLSNQPVFIEDKLTNTIFNLKQGNYTFTTAAGIFDDRFVLRYTDKTLSVDELEVNDGIIALYSNNYKTLIIRNNVKDATVNSVMLYNLIGQKIAYWDVKGREQSSIQIPIKNLPSEIYIVKIKTTKGEFSKKIIIK